MWCPRCESKEYVKNGKMQGLQRYKCKTCLCNFTQKEPRGKPRQLKMLALLLYISGLSMTRTAAIVGVSATSIVNWIKDYGKEFKLPQGNEEVVEVEIDEMWHYIKSKKTDYGSGALLNIKLTECLDIFVVKEAKDQLDNC